MRSIFVRDDSSVSIVSPPERRKLMYRDEKKRSRYNRSVLDEEFARAASDLLFAKRKRRERISPPRFHPLSLSLSSHPVIHLDGSQTRGQAQLHPRQKAARARRRFLVRRAWSAPGRRGEASRNETRRDEGWDEAQVLCRGQQGGFVVRIVERTGGTDPVGLVSSVSRARHRDH